VRAREAHAERRGVRDAYRCVAGVLQVCCKCGAKEGQTEERRDVTDTCKSVEGVFQACCRCVAGALQVRCKRRTRVNSFTTHARE